MAITLDDAMTEVRRGALHVSDVDDETGAYDNNQVQRAIRAIGHDLVIHTRCTLTTTDVSLSSGSHIVNLRNTSGLDNFEGTHFITADISGYRVERAPLSAIKRKYEGVTPTGRPKWIAFETPTRAWLYFEPNEAMTLSVAHTPPFTSFTIDTDSPEDVTFNVSDEIMLSGVLRYGAAALLVYGDPQSLYTTEAGGRYINLRNQIAQRYHRELRALIGSEADSMFPHLMREGDN